MNYLICTILTFTVFSIFGQIPPSEKKKILKILGEDFVEANSSSSNYFTDSGDPSVIVDTSLFVLGDTTGIHTRQEFVLFRDTVLSHFKNERLCLIRATPTTISDYQKFKNYVRDSIARLKLVYGLSDDVDAEKFVNWPKDMKGSERRFYGDRATDVEKYGINWETKFSYTDSRYIPILADMFLPVKERFRKQRIFDERKLEYLEQYKRPFRSTCIQDDYFLWAKNADHDSDELGVLSQIYPEIDSQNPIVGLLGTQANAFCHWKQINLQKKFNDAELPYNVVVTLPTIEQSSRFETNQWFLIKSRNYTDQWQISVGEYTEFLAHVKDSIFRTFLVWDLPHFKSAMKFLQAENYYFDEGALEYVDLDPVDRPTCLELFPLDYDRKIREGDVDIKASLERLRARNPKMMYRYSSIRTYAKAQPPIMKFRKETGTFYSSERRDEELYRDSILDRRRVYTIGYLGGQSYNDGVQRIWSLDKFIDEHFVDVDIHSALLEEESDALIPSLTYEQALAFYNWKYRIDQFNPKKDDWQSYVYPSEEEFHAIQRGESIVVPEHELEYPTPLFRYVVHIFPK